MDGFQGLCGQRENKNPELPGFPRSKGDTSLISRYALKEEDQRWDRLQE
jgi:hypothetical protein